MSNTIPVICHIPRDVYRSLSATADALSTPLRAVQVHTLIEVGIARSIRGQREESYAAAVLAASLAPVDAGAPKGLTQDIARTIAAMNADRKSDGAIGRHLGIPQPTISRYRRYLEIPPTTDRPHTGGRRRSDS